MSKVVKIGTLFATRLPAPAEPGSFPEGYRDDLLCYWPCGRGSFDLNLPGAGLACLANHRIVEDENGVITVSPSILLRGGAEDIEAHGFLERGLWRDA